MTPAELKAIEAKMTDGPWLCRYRDQMGHIVDLRSGDAPHFVSMDFTGFAESDIMGIVALRNRAEALVELWGIVKCLRAGCTDANEAAIDACLARLEAIK